MQRLTNGQEMHVAVLDPQPLTRSRHEYFKGSVVCPGITNRHRPALAYCPRSSFFCIGPAYFPMPVALCGKPLRCPRPAATHQQREQNRRARLQQEPGGKLTKAWPGRFFVVWVSLEASWPTGVDRLKIHNVRRETPLGAPWKYGKLSFSRVLELLAQSHETDDKGW